MESTDYDFYAAPALADVKDGIREKIGYFNAGFVSVKRKWIDRWDKNELKLLMKKWKHIPCRDQECLNYMVKTSLNTYCLLDRMWNCKAGSSGSMKKIMNEFNINTVFGMHFVHRRKKQFNISDIQSFEQQLDKQKTPSNSYKSFEVTNDWKNFQGSILDLEKRI